MGAVIQVQFLAWRESRVKYYVHRIFRNPKSQGHGTSKIVGSSSSSCIIIISTVVWVKVEEGGVYSPPWIFIDVCQKT
jgi:hypothetical protein